MLFHRRKYIPLFNLNSQNRKPLQNQQDSSNEFIEFNKEDDEEDKPQNTNPPNHYSFLQHKRTNEQEIPLLLHDSDNEQKDKANALHSIKKEDEIVNPEEEKIEDSSDSNLNNIIKDKINQIKEYKDNQRKCLLQENQDNLYGKTKAPKDMLNDIYQLMAENANKSEDGDSDNEEMLNRWETEQYKSGVNTNKIKVEHSKDNEVDEAKENIFDSFNKIRAKMDINPNEIVSSIQSALLKEEEVLTYYRKRKALYQEEISTLKNNESILEDKIEFYIDQYYRLKSAFCDLLTNEEIGKGNEEEDKYYLSS